MKVIVWIGTGLTGAVLACCIGVATVAVFKPIRHHEPFACKQVAANEWVCE